MPELPEVEIMCRNLTHWTENKKFTSIDGLKDAASILQKKIGACYRRGKYCILPVGEYFVVIHFRMTGKIVRLDTPRKFVRMCFFLDDGQQIALLDQRRFATVDILTKQEYLERMEAIGDEIWPKNHSGEWFAEKFSSSHARVKSLLLRQDIIAGIGNIMASEICFRMRCDPKKLANCVTTEQWGRMNDAIHDFVHAVLDEESGPEILFVSQGAPLPKSFLVYGRAGQACVYCQKPILHFTMNGRSTYACGACQD